MLQRHTPLKKTGNLKRTPLRRVSKRRAGELREYADKRKAYLAEHPVCTVWCREHGYCWVAPRIYQIGGKQVTAVHLLTFIGIEAPAATEIHHVNKRRGAMLNDERFWLAVCHANHERIERDKAWARREGYLLHF